MCGRGGGEKIRREEREMEGRMENEGERRIERRESEEKKVSEE